MEPLAAVKSMIRLVRNPTHTHEVFTIIRALSGSDLRTGLDRFKDTEFGESAFFERGSTERQSQKRNLLGKLPAGSLGREYQKNSCRRKTFWRTGLKRQISDPYSLKLQIRNSNYSLQGKEICMTLWHVVTGYGRDELGEACLLALHTLRTRTEVLASLLL